MLTATALAAAAPAKINLFLHVIGRRADGYHLLDSLAIFAGIGDTLRVEPADDLSLLIEGEHAAELADAADNLVLRAARALAAAAGIVPRARLVLDKRLPVAAGIGGGSADAAAALRLLARLWGLGQLDEAKLFRIAAGLGSDVPVCLAGAARIGPGPGESRHSPRHRGRISRPSGAILRTGAARGDMARRRGTGRRARRSRQ